MRQAPLFWEGRGQRASGGLVTPGGESISTDFRRGQKFYAAEKGGGRAAVLRPRDGLPKISQGLQPLGGTPPGAQHDFRGGLTRMSQITRSPDYPITRFFPLPSSTQSPLTHPGSPASYAPSRQSHRGLQNCG